jgi:5-methylcytosine-specific restriction enzyme A
MHKRSKEFWLAAFFLSKFGEINNNGQTKPPYELQTNKWNEAYRMFYEKLNEGRTISSFEHSLKNARDAYDSHIKSSNRIGWRDESRNPNLLNKSAKTIFDTYSEVKRITIWEKLVPYNDKSIIANQLVFDDLISIEDSENNKSLISKTEGGKKVIISYRYERNPSLRGTAFQIHGYDCAVCGFNFFKTYGIWGKEFCEVHHVKPLSSLGDVKGDTNPKTDLVVVCANCHRMLHRKKGVTLTIEELKSKLIL